MPHSHEWNAACKCATCLAYVRSLLQ